MSWFKKFLLNRVIDELRVPLYRELRGAAKGTSFSWDDKKVEELITFLDAFIAKHLS